MVSLYSLLRAGFLTTALDIDNAMYMTAVADNVSPRQQNKLIVVALLLEFLGRIAIIAAILWVFDGREITFVLFGTEMSLEAVALIGAGSFLFLRSVRELIRFFRGEEADDEMDMTVVDDTHFPRLLIETTIVNLTLSVDTILAITGNITAVWQLLYVLSFSAVVRLLFVKQITAVINRFSSLNIIIFTLLTLIGLELFLQGFGLSFPEEEFNLILATAVVIAVMYERRQQRIGRFLEKLRH